MLEGSNRDGSQLLMRVLHRVITHRANSANALDRACRLLQYSVRRTPATYSHDDHVVPVNQSVNRPDSLAMEDDWSCASGLLPLWRSVHEAR